MYARKLGASENALMKALWGDWYYIPKTKKILKKKAAQAAVAGASSSAAARLRPMFVQFVLEPVWQIYEAASQGSNSGNSGDSGNSGNSSYSGSGCSGNAEDGSKSNPILEKIISSLGLSVPPKDLQHKDPRTVAQSVIARWLPLAPCILSMVVDCLPDPVAAQKDRLGCYLPNRPTVPSGSVDRSGKEGEGEEEGGEERVLRQVAAVDRAVEMCDSSEEAPCVVFVSKMFAVPFEMLPREEQRAEEDAAAAAAAAGGGAGAGGDLTTVDDLAGSVRDRDFFFAFARVFCGRLRAGQRVFVLSPLYDPCRAATWARHRQEAQVGALFMMMGQGLQPISSVPAGNCVAIKGLEACILKSATVASTPYCQPFSSMVFQAAPIVRVAIEPEDPRHLPLLARGLRLLNRADPFVEVVLARSGEHVVGAAGEVHLERCIKDLQERFARIKLVVSKPIVSFRETIAPTGYATGHATGSVTGSTSASGSENASVFPTTVLTVTTTPGPPPSLTSVLGAGVDGTSSSGNSASSLAAASLSPLAALAANSASSSASVASGAAIPLGFGLGYALAVTTTGTGTSSGGAAAAAAAAGSGGNPANSTFATLSSLRQRLLEAIDEADPDEGLDASGGGSSASAASASAAASSSSAANQPMGAEARRTAVADFRGAWRSKLERIWSLGPRHVGPNLLLAPIPVTSGGSSTVAPNPGSRSSTVPSTSGVSGSLPPGGVVVPGLPEASWKLGLASTGAAQGGAEETGKEVGGSNGAVSGADGEEREEREGGAVVGDASVSPSSAPDHEAALRNEAAGETSQDHDDVALQHEAEGLAGSVVSGFQLATSAGPLCEEPLWGLAFTVEVVIVMSAVKDACRAAVAANSPRLVEAMFLCEVTTTTEALGAVYAVLGRRRAAVVREEMNEGSGMFTVHAHLPMAESFGFAEELRGRTSGAASPQLAMSHWSMVPDDPFFVPRTEEEREEYGDSGVGLDRRVLPSSGTIITTTVIMARSTPLVFVLLCAAFFTVAASASIFPLFLPKAGVSAGTAAAAQAKPLVWKGKTVSSEVRASGKHVAKVVRYSATTYYATYHFAALNIKSGGKAPLFTHGFSCTEPSSGPDIQWVNITSDRTGRRKRYSFTFTVNQGPHSLADSREEVAGYYKVFGPYMRIGLENSKYPSLCGKVKKVKG
ncbi:unnamed protein product [Closterium sp. Yama58-4]|nr:unnamed protein product [Closterium sp. Yama58-4]